MRVNIGDEQRKNLNRLKPDISPVHALLPPHQTAIFSYRLLTVSGAGGEEKALLVMALAPRWEQSMAQPQQSSFHNRLLAGLSAEDRDLLQPRLEPVPLEMRQMLFEAGEAI